MTKARRTITVKELTAEMQKRIESSNELGGDCRECKVPGIYRLRKPDATGCNWAPSAYQGAPDCAGVIALIVREFQELYNVVSG